MEGLTDGVLRPARVFNRVSTDVERLQRLVTDLEELSRLDAGLTLSRRKVARPG
jgi:signal transduction histidine kinase